MTQINFYCSFRPVLIAPVISQIATCHIVSVLMEWKGESSLSIGKQTIEIVIQGQIVSMQTFLSQPLATS